MDYILKPIKNALQYFFARYKVSKSITNYKKDIQDIEDIEDIENTTNSSDFFFDSIDHNNLDINYNNYNFKDLIGKIDDIDLSTCGDTFFARISLHTSSLIMYSFVFGIKNLQEKIIVKIEKNKGFYNIYHNDKIYYWYPNYKCIMGPSKIIKNFFNNDTVFVQYNEY